jgi:UDP-3-O-[3-hydroxymyristoyl] N-acetylglucosamine deacetylase
VTAITGFGLHTGSASTVRFTPHDGPVVLRVRGIDVPVSELRVVDTSRSTTVENASGTVRVATIEHVLAALGGLGIHRGVLVCIDGAEPPLADGAARQYADALLALGPELGASTSRARSRAPLRVARDGVVELGASRYELWRDERDDQVEVEVAVDFEDIRIATARTFGFEHEVSDLLARGLASHVTKESVVVFGKDRVLSSGAPVAADEPARHKLLDLLGDLYLHGGPPRGRLRATRPGHAATHHVMLRALAEGLLVRDRR